MSGVQIESVNCKCQMHATFFSSQFLIAVSCNCQTMKSLKVRVSVIGLSAEVRVCTMLTRETGGSYHVILDESHFKELLLTLHVKPPPASSSSECSLIRMGQYVDVYHCSSSVLPLCCKCQYVVPAKQSLISSEDNL